MKVFAFKFKGRDLDQKFRVMLSPSSVFLSKRKNDYSRIRKSIALLSPKDTTMSDELKILDVSRGAVKQIPLAFQQPPSDQNATTSK